MPLNDSTIYFFRGTTIGYAGGEQARKMPYTCTSTNPAKALLFALTCLQFNPTETVVYIARRVRLERFDPIFNHFETLEEEVAFPITPVEFYTYCEGYIQATDLQTILANNGIVLNQVINLGNLSMLLEEIPILSDSQIIKIVEEIGLHLKKISNL